MLEPESWQHLTTEVPRGRKVYVNHDCGGGSTLIISNDDRGYSAWCFRCNDGGSMKHPELSLPELLAQQRAMATQDARFRCTPDLPYPAVYDVKLWPPEAALWLFKAGLGYPEIRKLGAYYHEDMRRVVLPVRTNGEVVYWQARAFDKWRKPKYINPLIDKQKVLPVYGSHDIVILTEDILSAFKVGQVYEGWSLLGTKLNDHTMARLLARRCTVVVWLDPDEAGQSAADKIVVQLLRYGIKAKRLVTNRDPKMYSREEIRLLC